MLHVANVDVEAALVEPMRGSLERQMGDPLAGNAVDDAMEFDRIGRRQRAVFLAGRRDHPDGADAGGGMSERGPDLAREGRNRSLAAGAGDGRNDGGLPRIELCRRKRQRAPRIGYIHQRDMVRQRMGRLALRHYGDRAPCDRLRHEREPVRLGAAHGD